MAELENIKIQQYLKNISFNKLKSQHGDEIPNMHLADWASKKLFIKPEQVEELLNDLNKLSLKNQIGHSPNLLQIQIVFQPLITLNFIPNLQELFSTAYFHGFLTMKEAEKTLESCSENKFIFSLDSERLFERTDEPDDKFILRFSQRVKIWRTIPPWSFAETIRQIGPDQLFRSKKLTFRHEKILSTCNQFDEYNSMHKVSYKTIAKDHEKCQNSKLTCVKSCQKSFLKPCNRSFVFSLKLLSMVAIADATTYEKLTKLEDEIPTEIFTDFKKFTINSKISKKIFCNNIQNIF